MLHAARETDIQVIWDLCHYGWPDYLDIFKPEFVRCFAAFARAFAHLLNEETDAVPFISPVNEISFFAWASGEVGYFFPYVEGRGMELKAQLVHATIEGIEGVWNIVPRTRIVHADPMINVVASPQRSYESEAAEAYRLAQYEAWDMLAGRMKSELGGAEKYLDCLGINYYPHNQWFVHKPSYNPAHALPRTHPLYKPFRRILQETYERYRRPVFIAETGSEGIARVE